jgi:hypothetical protein
MKLRPRLVDLSGSEWDQLYANFSGEGSVSSHSWYTAVHTRLPQSQIKFLVARFSEGHYAYLPCFVRKGRFAGRSFQALANAGPLGASSPQEATKAIEELGRASVSLTSISFDWIVPPGSVLDQVKLDSLKRSGVRVTTIDTFVIDLSGGYDEVFGKYNSTQRNQVRRSRREGVRVECCDDHEQARQFFEVYKSAFTQGGWSGQMFPLEHFCMIADNRVPEAKMLVAEIDGKVLGGGVFLYLKDWIHYSLGAVDRSVSKFYPMSNVIDVAIQLACKQTAKKFNFGAVPGASSSNGQVHFKRSWGAHSVMQIRLSFSSPLARIWKKARTVLS